MASDGKVVFQIEGDARGVKTTIKDVTSDIEKESKKWDDAVEKSSDDMTKSFSKAFDIERVKNWAIQGVKALVKFGEAAVSTASDLAEVQNVVDVTFGDSARQIDTWAQSAGNAYGLTELQAKKYASTIGAMVKSQGVAENQIVGMSENLAGLAADMTSFYNLDFDTAFEKLRSGISGETEPLKQLGINMSVASLEAFALEHGITKSYAAMSQGEQTILRYQYIMKATADAQGDFARTSDGFANSTRRFQTSLETIKAKTGNILMKVIEPLTNGLADLLGKITETQGRTVLDDFVDINKDYGAKMGRLNAAYEKAIDLVSVMEDLKVKTASLGNGKTITFEELFGDLNNVKQSGGDVREYIGSLGLDVDYVAKEYGVWQDSISRLTSTIPSLTSVIDAQTGAINGGTDAIRTNIEEYKSALEQKYILEAYYAKLDAIEKNKGELGGYQLDYDLALKEWERARDRLLSQHPDIQFDSADRMSEEWLKQNNYRLTDGVSYFAITTAHSWDSSMSKYAAATNKLNKARGTLISNEKDLATAEQQVADLQQILIDKYGESAVAAFKSGNVATESVEDVAAALSDYTKAFHDSMAQTVDSIVKGFDVLKRPTQDLFEKRSKLIEQQNELNLSTKEGKRRYQELQGQIDDLNRSMDEYSPTGMKNGLESQLAFMDEYIKNLEKAQQMGLSSDLLASLSDGSVQSAEYLANLVANPEQAAQVDQLYQRVQEKKKEFIDSLTEQKLAADDTFDAIAQKAKETVDGLDMADSAKTAAENTVNGIAAGIDAGSDAVRAAVERVKAIMRGLTSGFGVSYPVNFVGPLPQFSLDGEHETGLDYVPFDGYLAGLHEGEGILTAEENRIWQRFKNGSQPQTMDYDALGATMRENVQAGGNVYLDGRTVGQVLSAAQGQSYRAMTRSGFQG